MFKSRIEVREYAMNKAIELMGTGAPGKHVVEKAKEIESYIIGEAELPETIDENELISTAIETLGIVASQWLKKETASPVSCPIFESTLYGSGPKENE